jgi:V8-like Glu-specific endopeptidase
MTTPLSPFKPIAIGTARRAPFRWVCRIVVDHGKRVLAVPAQLIAGDPHHNLNEPEVAGSGLLISPRHVLTCGHILADGRDARHRPRRVTVHFDANAGRSGLGVKREPTFWTARNAWFHPRLLAPGVTDDFKKSWESRSFDVGLIELNSNAGVFPGESLLADPRERFGWWGEAAPNYFMSARRPPGWLGTRKVNVYGFPGGTTKVHWGFGAVSAVLHRDASMRRLHTLIRYAVATRPGTSGGPLWTVDTDPLERRLIGIHGGDWDREAGALLLNPDIIAFLRSHGVRSRLLEAADTAHAPAADEQAYE